MKKLIKYLLISLFIFSAFPASGKEKADSTKTKTALTLSEFLAKRELTQFNPDLGNEDFFIMNYAGCVYFDKLETDFGSMLVDWAAAQEMVLRVENEKTNLQSSLFYHQQQIGQVEASNNQLKKQNAILRKIVDETAKGSSNILQGLETMEKSYKRQKMWKGITRVLKIGGAGALGFLIGSNLG